MLNDQERLEALRLSGLLRKSGDERVMSIARSVRQVLDVDAAMVHVVSGTYQYRIGYDPGDLPHDPEPLSSSACSLVVLSRDTLAVSDTIDHPVVCDMPWAGAFRSYLSAPVFWADQVIGTVCCVGREPREWRPFEKLTIEAFARLTSAASQ